MKNKQQDIGFACGLGYAIAQMERAGQDQWSEYLFQESGMDYADFEECVTEYDLEEIKKVAGRLEEKE